MIQSEKKYRQKINLGQGSNTLMMLIIINLTVFILFAFLKVLWHFQYADNQVAVSLFNKNVLSWFTLPADGNKIIGQPWSLITHMFLHIGIWQVLANMLWLWCFGYIMQDLTGNKKIIPVFIYGALAGAIAFILSYNLLPSLRPQLPVARIMGASAGIMAIAIATTLVAPRYRIFPMLNGGIPVWILTAIYVVIDFVTIPSNDIAIYISHLAGAFMGFTFIFLLRRGYDWSEWMNNFFDWVGNLFNPDKPRKGKSIKEELFYKSSGAAFKKTPNITQQRVDEILDKISQKGYNYLTEEEKELLNRAGQEEN